MKTARDSREWKTGETAEIIETGVSTVCIKTNYEDRYNSHITHRLLITNGDGTIADSVLQVLDLETSETRNYAVEQQRMSVSEIEWINDDEIITVEMTGTYNNRKFVINWYALEDSQVVLKNSFTDTGIERSPDLQNSQFINKIWYQGEEYLCVIEPKAGSDTSYDAVFYNTALEETARKPFTTKAAADEVRWIGIQDDTILITTKLCK